MKIGLLMENSQAAKNAIVYEQLKIEATKAKHEVLNFGMYNDTQEHQLTYVQLGLLTAILLETKTVDFVVTGCGTGQGAMMAANSYENVQCGHLTTPLDAFLFSQVNSGNAVSLAFAQNYGWGGEINVRYIFEKLFEEEFGKGYPQDRVIPQQRNKKILDQIKKSIQRPLIEVLKTIDQEFLKSSVNYPEFKELFLAHSENSDVTSYVKDILGA